MEQFSFYPEAWFNGEAQVNYEHRADWEFDEPGEDRHRSLSGKVTKREVISAHHRTRTLTPGNPSRVLSVFAALRRLNWPHATP
jgi:hypothetical protein